MRPATDKETTISSLKEAVSAFVQERGWKKFHSPKNLAESICIESSELLELFQWLTDRESETFTKDSAHFDRLSSELADVLIYCLALANATKIDVASSVLSKLEESAGRYPVSEYTGRAPRRPDSGGRKA